MANVIARNGVGMLYNPDDGRALPVVTGEIGNDYFDPLFVAGDPTNPRTDLFIIQVLSWELGTWEIQVVTGDALPAQNEIDTVTASGDSGSYTFATSTSDNQPFDPVTINVGDDQAAIQASVDGTYGGMGFVVAGAWDSWTFEAAGTYALQPMPPHIIDISGLVNGTASVVRTQHGSTGTGDQPPTPTDATLLATVAVPPDAASWDDCTFTDQRTVANPQGLWNGGTVTRDTVFLLSDESLIVRAKPGAGDPAHFVVENEDFDDVVHVEAFRAGDGAFDRVGLFGVVGLLRSDVPTVDWSGETPAVQAALAALAALGVIIDGT